MKERVGFCGLYCDSCTMYRAFHDNNPKILKEAPKKFQHRFGFENAGLKTVACDGCRSPDPHEYCASCEIRKCVQEKHLEWCFECNQYPCQRLYNFESFWRMPIVSNLNQIREIGIEAWLIKQKTEWQCEACGSKLHWFSFGICPHCRHEKTDPGMT